MYRAGVLIGTTASTTYSSTGLTAATTYSYTVTAVDAAGNTSTQSTSASATTATPPDTMPPTVSITSPTGGTIAGTIPVTVNAADNVGVTLVNLRVNGVIVASTNVVPYQVAWDSTTVSNGSVALTAVAKDAAGNSTTSAPITVNVSNGTASTITPLSLNFISPANGAIVTGQTQITTIASDTLTSAIITQKLYIDDTLKTTVTGNFTRLPMERL